MALAHNPRIVTDGLVLCLDAANSKSYPGSGTTWTDLSGNGNNATLVNGISNTSGYFDLDGASDYIAVSTINRTTTATMEIWFNTDSTSTNTAVRQYLYTQQKDPPVIASHTYKERHGVHIAGNVVQAQYLNSSNTDTALTSNTILQPNTWYHLVLVINNTSNVLYLNGVVQATSSVQAQAVTVSEAFIGRRFDANGNDWLNGKVSVVRDYSKALTANEVAQNFAALRGRYGI